MTTPKSPTNDTAAIAARDMGTAAAYMLPGGIEAMEKRGQAEIVASEVLPVRCLGCTDEEFTALGFTFGDVVAGDPLFRAATLPTGWKRAPTDHDMWSKIVDERGLRRVAIFYKAAFYDRAAHMRITNVGADVANTALYGDDPVTAESMRLADLTTSERIELVKSLDTMRQQIADSPRIYGDYEERLGECDTIVAAAGA